MTARIIPLSRHQRGHMDLGPVVVGVALGGCLLGAAFIVAGCWLLWHGVRMLMGA